LPLTPPLPLAASQPAGQTGEEGGGFTYLPLPQSATFEPVSQPANRRTSQQSATERGWNFVPKKIRLPARERLTRELHLHLVDDDDQTLAHTGRLCLLAPGKRMHFFPTPLLSSPPTSPLFPPGKLADWPASQLANASLNP